MIDTDPRDVLRSCLNSRRAQAEFARIHFRRNGQALRDPACGENAWLKERVA